LTERSETEAEPRHRDVARQKSAVTA